MDMGRPRTPANAELPPNLSESDGRFRYRSPLDSIRRWVGSDREAAIRLAKDTNAVYAAIQAQRKPGMVTVGQGVVFYRENVLPHKPWDTGTRKNEGWKLDAIEREIGDRAIATTDRVFLGDWLDSKATTSDAYNKWRARLVDLWAYFIARKWCDYNEADAVMKRSTSKKLAHNQKVRHRLELEGFWAIHDHESAPPFLRVAMQLSLVLLQARHEVVNLKKSDFRDGRLYVIRDKTAADTEMAFISIEVDAQLEAIYKLAFSDGIPCPYLVHYRPERERREWRNAKPHAFAVTPKYLTDAFRDTRNATGQWSHLQPRERPSFHEILSLGMRLYRKAGQSRDYIRALRGHADEKTTDIYLQGGVVTDDRYQQVTAGLTLEGLR